ncbi:MAG: AraC family transcriptional regulator [Verrucomicrobiota bacterium]
MIRSAKINSQHTLRKREGFPGQRLIVLPAPLIAKLLRDPLLRDLCVTATGFFPKAPGHYVERHRGTDDTILIRVLGGTGWVEAGERQRIFAGEFVIIPSGLPHAYGADDADPWTIEWAHFQGASASGFSSLLGAADAPQTLRLDERGMSIPSIALLYEWLERGCTHANLLRASSHLRSALTSLHLAQLTDPSRHSEEAVRRSAEWMRDHLETHPPLSSLAQAAGLSLPHYCALFRRLTGCPPMEHFQRLRIQRACQLLDTTSLRVSEVAALLGWQDPFYFSRCFRKATGKSPKTWRSNQKI